MRVLGGGVAGGGGSTCGAGAVGGPRGGGRGACVGRGRELGAGRLTTNRGPQRVIIRGPTPRTRRSRSPALRNGRWVRACTIRSAITGPTPGRVVSAATEAVFTSTGVVLVRALGAESKARTRRAAADTRSSRSEACARGAGDGMTCRRRGCPSGGPVRPECPVFVASIGPAALRTPTRRASVPGSMSAERRRHPRVEVDLLVQYRADTFEDFLVAYCTNLSESGQYQARARCRPAPSCTSSSCCATA